MKTRSSQLEDLPNELLADIFKNLDARDVFRAFSNLNSRLNHLIRYLQPTFHLTRSNAIKINGELFPYYVYTLIVDPWINFALHRFSNVRRLTLNSPLPHILEQLNPESMPYLEHLSVAYEFYMYEIVLLHEKIFSNRFRHLISCELFGTEGVMAIQHSQSSPSIQILKIEWIDGKIFAAILSACPNLSILKFSMISVHVPTPVQTHVNLKRLIIKLRDDEWSHDDRALSGFLACVPNVQQLKIHRHYHFSTNINDYDWLASILPFRLRLLRRFQFCISLSDDEQSKKIFNDDLRRKFVDLHQGLYDARLEFDGN